MSGTPKKNAHREAPVSAPEPAVERFDILTELAIDGGAPQPITLRGVDAEVRCTYTGDEAARFHALVAKNELRDALDLITDGKGQQIWDAVADLPSTIVARLLNKVISLSGLSEGELRPLSPPSSERMAGAVLSQAVADGLASTSAERSENSTGATAAA
ncbi:hypothetical protein [Rhodococcus sp. YH1]|uniref:hypothetical protein n=1 Tax=Rhodococcus sp. YH1 TaxID=89066 RepID=UPI001386E354|nr:hypothetical protein [Rhodococcus sp. YH1]NCL78807.1 hypothetical protein [Rhodococcus sp. YH1]